MCLVLIFLYKIVEKHTLKPKITLLNQFHAQKALFKVTIPPLLEVFQKVICFGAVNRP